MQLARALRIGNKEIVAFVGAGGKTTALFRLVDELVAQNRRVIVTTTTRFGTDQIAPGTLRYTDTTSFLARVRDALREHRRVMIVGDDAPENKVAGVLPEFIDHLATLGIADTILYEADGARKLPFKAPAAHEPVIALSTTLVVSVIGATVFDNPLDEKNVHRPEIVAQFAGEKISASVTPEIISRVLTHPQGGLKNIPAGARAVVLVNQVDDDSRLSDARTLAHELLACERIGGVAIGATQNATNPIRETHRRVAAIVLAAGAGTRMGGRIKQLLPWRGKTLIENAIAIATQSVVRETIIVLGAHADNILPVVEKLPVRIVSNPAWAQGHSTSIRAGINALASDIDAAIFINADQPLLTSDVVNRIIQRFRETDAPIIVPIFAGKRASPVLFQRQYFPELAALRDEQGGRELLAKYQAERIEFAEAEYGVDVDTLDDYAKLT